MNQWTSALKLMVLTNLFKKCWDDCYIFQKKVVHWFANFMKVNQCEPVKRRTVFSNWIRKVLLSFSCRKLREGRKFLKKIRSCYFGKMTTLNNWFTKHKYCWTSEPVNKWGLRQSSHISELNFNLIIKKFWFTICQKNLFKNI